MFLWTSPPSYSKVDNNSPTPTPRDLDDEERGKQQEHEQDEDHEQEEQKDSSCSCSCKDEQQKQQEQTFDGDDDVMMIDSPDRFVTAQKKLAEFITSNSTGAAGASLPPPPLGRHKVVEDEETQGLLDKACDDALATALSSAQSRQVEEELRIESLQREETRLRRQAAIAARQSARRRERRAREETYTEEGFVFYHIKGLWNACCTNPCILVSAYIGFQLFLFGTLIAVSSSSSSSKTLPFPTPHSFHRHLL